MYLNNIIKSMKINIPSALQFPLPSFVIVLYSIFLIFEDNLNFLDDTLKLGAILSLVWLFIAGYAFLSNKNKNLNTEKSIMTRIVNILTHKYVQAFLVDLILNFGIFLLYLTYVLVTSNHNEKPTRETLIAMLLIICILFIRYKRDTDLTATKTYVVA